MPKSGPLAIAFRLALPILSAGAILSASIPAQADAPVAPMTTHGNYIAWHPTGAYESINLRISAPDGSVTDQVFAAPGPITITAPTQLGVYQYELVVTPKVAPGQRAAMEKQRAEHPGGEFSGGVKGGAQSGAFTVVSGGVLDNTLAE